MESVNQPNTTSQISSKAQNLHQAPQPEVVRINRFAFVLIASVVLIVFVIGFYSLSSNGEKHKHVNATPVSSDQQPATQAQGDWAEKEAEAALLNRKLAKRKIEEPAIKNGATNLSANINLNANNANSVDIKKRRDEALLAAMSSPLSASGMQNNFQNTTPVVANTANSQNSSAISETETPNEPTLPLSHKQIAKLQNLLGGSDQNQQAQKQAFLGSVKSSLNKDYLLENLNKPISRFEIKAGTVIPSIMVSGINSDLPGQAVAQVRQNVYDSVSGKYLLIPQGAKLIIAYDSQVSYGQSRVLVAVKRIIFPNGSSMNLEGMPGADISGYAGFKDQIDNHYLKTFGSAAMLGLISAGLQLSQPQQSSAFQNPNSTQIAAAAMGQQMGQVANGLVNKNLNIQPTLTIRPGFEFNVTVTADLLFPGIYQDNVGSKNSRSN